MSEDKALPKGLKDEEVVGGRIRRPPIPYIPLKDPIQESIEKISGKKVSRSRYQMGQLFTTRCTMVALMNILLSM